MTCTVLNATTTTILDNIECCNLEEKRVSRRGLQRPRELCHPYA